MRGDGVPKARCEGQRSCNLEISLSAIPCFKADCAYHVFSYMGGDDMGRYLVSWNRLMGLEESETHKARFTFG
jgi:hypothetical protein